MSYLKNHLTGKTAVILYKRYWTTVQPIRKCLCMIRFEVDGWSSVVHGVGKQRYIAGSRALQAYVAFCETYGLVYLDPDGSLMEYDGDYPDYGTTDEAYAEGYQGKR